MASRDLSLSPRSENVRELKCPQVPVHFSREEILKHFDESMVLVREKFDVADQLLTDSDVEGCKYIWRTQVVFVEGFLDYYLHEISKYCLYQMYCGNWDRSERFGNMMVPISWVDRAVSSSNGEWFFEFLNERFSKDVFLSKESMKDQLNLIGVGFTEVMEMFFPEDTQSVSVKKGKKLIEDLFSRRNKIVHQNDRSHATALQNDIDREYVENYLGYVEKLVHLIHDIVDKKDNEIGTFVK